MRVAAAVAAAAAAAAAVMARVARAAARAVATAAVAASASAAATAVAAAAVAAAAAAAELARAASSTRRHRRGRRRRGRRGRRRRGWRWCERALAEHATSGRSPQKRRSDRLPRHEELNLDPCWQASRVATGQREKGIIGPAQRKILLEQTLRTAILRAAIRGHGRLPALGGGLSLDRSGPSRAAWTPYADTAHLPAHVQCAHMYNHWHQEHMHGRSRQLT